jgi:hypothetical protein
VILDLLIESIVWLGLQPRPTGNRRHTPVSEDLAIRAQVLEEGGPPLWDAFMDELRRIHLGAPGDGRSVFAELQAAYEATVAKITPDGVRP